MTSKHLVRLAAFVLMVASLAILAGCGNLQGEEKGKAPRASSSTVEIFDFRLRPQTLEVSTGTRVTWINKDPVDHTVTADNGSFDKLLKSGDQYSYTFKKAGTVRYKDRLNSQPGLRGKIVVE
jgi:plastocyanin